MNQHTAPNVYDFPMREYGIQGRWPSPDPAGLAAVNPMDPQTWNRYAYVRNSPLELIDPLGLDQCPAGTEGVGSSGTCVVVSGGGGSSTDLLWYLFTLSVDGWSEPYLIYRGPLGGHGGGGGRSGTPATNQTATQTKPPCTELRRAAGQIGGTLRQTSEDFGLISAGGFLATGLSGFGEGPTFGLDTGLTITAGSLTAFFGQAGLVTGAAAAAFNSYASGNLRALSNFDLSRLAGLATTLASSRLPFAGRFAETLGYAAEQAVSIASEAEGGCQ